MRYVYSQNCTLMTTKTRSRCIKVTL